MANSIKQEVMDALDFFYKSNNLTFNESKHQYKLDGVTCAGISTISDYRPMPYLKAWAAKAVVEFLKDKQEIIAKATKEEFEALLLEAKNQHAKRTKEALSIGQQVHDWTDKHQQGIDLPITDEMSNSVKAYLAFEKEHDVEWLASEKIVCSPTYLVAGRVDDIALVNGILTVVDKKTSNRISESYFLQTAGYMYCLREMGIPIQQRVILRLPKTKGDTFEAALVETDYHKDVQCFFHQRYAREWDNYVECEFKEKVKVGRYYESKLKIKKL